MSETTSKLGPKNAAGLLAATARRKEMRERGEKMEILSPIEKSRRNPGSLRASINGKCWDCQGGGDNPSTRWLIGNCTSPGCCLFGVRPYQGHLGRPAPADYTV